MSLLHEITRHLAVTREPESRFGRRVVCDPRLVSDLRRGREPGEKTVARVRAAIADREAAQMAPSAAEGANQ